MDRPTPNRSDPGRPFRRRARSQRRWVKRLSGPLAFIVTVLVCSAILEPPGFIASLMWQAEAADAR